MFPTPLEEDVIAGRAVFYLTNPNDIDARPYDIDDVALPRCAILTDEELGEEVPVIVIQAEQANDMIYSGYRFLCGGNGICTPTEIELLDGLDARFHNSSK